MIFRLSLLLCIGCLLQACATPAPLPEPRVFRTSEPVADSSDFHASDLFVEAVGTWTYDIDAGEREGETATLRRTITDRFNAVFADEEIDRRTQFWSIDSDGALLLTAVLEPADSALTFFDPPLLIAPATLAPGESAQTESAMRIMDMNNPRQQRERGKGISSIQYLGEERVFTPLGELTAKKVSTRFEAKLSMATAVTESTLWIVPEMGVIAEESSERISALGLFNRTSTRRIVLRESPKLK